MRTPLLRRFLTALLVVTSGLFLFPTIARAANWYVRPNGGNYGLENGTNWSNAFDGFSGISWASVSCGDTVWVAGGDYTQPLNLQKNCSSGPQLYIRRARSDALDATGSVGWNVGFDSTVNHIGSNGGTNISAPSGVNTAYITLSGRTIEGGGATGWYENFTATDGGTGIEFENGSLTDHLTFEYMEIRGPGDVVYPNGGRGIDATPFSACSGSIFSHMKIWDWESGVYLGGCDGTVFEYIDMTNIMATNWSEWHPNGMYICDSPNGTVRYSRFYKQENGCGEGVFLTCGGNDGWRIYGNLFYDLDQTGMKAIELQSAAYNDLKIWNNVFDNILTGPIYVNSDSGCGPGSEFKNNLSFSGAQSCGTTANNLVTTNSAVVVNRTAKDYRPISSVGASFPRDAGADLSSYFTTDMDGNPFGADGTWDIGAYEYVAGGSDTTPPAAPSGLGAQ